VLVWQHDLAGLRATCQEVNVDAQDDKSHPVQGNTALHVATMLGNLEAASVLLKFYIDFHSATMYVPPRLAGSLWQSHTLKSLSNFET